MVSYSKEKRTKVAINKFGIFTTRLALTLSCPDTHKGQNPRKKLQQQKRKEKTSTIKEKMFKARG